MEQWWCKSRTHDWSSLPHEILLPIFEYIQPYIHQHDPSVIPGPRSPWLTSLRTKKALTLVCKAWTPPATAVLYNDIVIRRMGQISALANTLNQHPDLSDLVRSIRLDSCVVWSHCSNAVRKGLGHILSRCVRLATFSYHAHEHFAMDRWDVKAGAEIHGLHG